MALLGYSKCPKCGEIAKKEDGYVGGKLSSWERKQRATAKKVIGFLLPNYQIEIKFP
jgi:hypothetical protein